MTATSPAWDCCTALLPSQGVRWEAVDDSSAHATLTDGPLTLTLLFRFKLDALGLRARGVQPADPKAYGIYGARVLAPCAGQVLLAVDGLPDMQVPEVDREHLAGNHVMLRCVGPHTNADVLLGHLRPGSVQVRARTSVAVGDGLGSVGNSGNTGEPHLHVHAQHPGPAGSPLGGDPLPVLFGGRFPVRGDRIESPSAAR